SAWSACRCALPHCAVVFGAANQHDGPPSFANWGYGAAVAVAWRRSKVSSRREARTSRVDDQAKSPTAPAVSPAATPVGAAIHDALTATASCAAITAWRTRSPVAA